MKSNKLFELFGTNKKLETEGIDVVIGSNKETDPVFVIARAGGHNQDYLQALSRFSSKASNIRLSIEEDRKELQSLYYKTVVKIWRNVRDENDKPLDFTKDNMIALFEKLPDLWVYIRDIATDQAKFQQDFAENIAKK